MSELKPCPICGAKVEIDDPEAYKRSVGYHITCDPCYLQFWAFAGESPASLIARWNDRQKTIALLQGAESALAPSYEVTEYPASDDSPSIALTSPPYFEDDEPCGYCDRPIGARHKGWCRQ